MRFKEKNRLRFLEMKKKSLKKRRCVDSGIMLISNAFKLKGNMNKEVRLL